MAKIRNPITFAEYFRFPSGALKKAGLLNPTLNLDTGLFIDPLLLRHSKHPEIRDGARKAYDEHFTTVIKLLRASRHSGDAPWRSVLRYLSFPEIKWTCLGYGAQSVSGSGSGSDMTTHLIRTAKEIVDLGINDPDLFVAMALFEEGFGPDRISDMTANVILGDLIGLNERVLAGLPVPREEVILALRNGKSYKAVLPINPFVKGRAPIVLVPTDILRDLPIVKDWSDIADAASKNEQLRWCVNRQIAELWRAKTLKDKNEVRHWALSGEKEFGQLLEMIRGAAGRPYDVEGDPKGELFWRELARTLPTMEPLVLKAPPQLDINGVASVVDQVIEQFRFLVEKRRYSDELHHEGRPRPEKAAQRLFFIVAHAYCKANNLDITPEADTGNGPVDFKVASGFTGRVVVEIKLSTNAKLEKGYTHQLAAYRTAEESIKGYYVVIDVGKMGKKRNALTRAMNDAAARGDIVSPIIYVDGTPKPSASKL